MAIESRQIPELDRSGLKRFGLTTGAIVAGLFGLLLPWIFERGLPVWPWVFFAALASWALILPNSLRPVYRGWMHIGLLISRVTTPIILGIVFFLVVLPFGLVRRLFRLDSLNRNLDPDASTYRVKTQQNPKENLENPY